MVAAPAIAVALALGGHLLLSRPAGLRATVGAGQPDTGSGAGSRTGSTRPAPDRPGCARPSVWAADLDGDGCLETLTVANGTIRAGTRTFAIGEPDDAVALGDWDCDGTATAAVVRPRTGEVFLFTSWAQADVPVTLAPSAVVPAGSTPEAAAPGRCGPLKVRHPDGGSQEVVP